MIKAIIFDCFGVLTSDLWREFVDGLPKEVDSDRARELNRQYGAGRITRQQFLDAIFEVTGRHPKEVETRLDNETTKNTPLLDYIGELRGRGYKIGLLSNIATDWIRSSFLTPTEQKLFDDMVLSFEVHMTKPEHQIFRLACDRLSVRPQETIFVDDIPGYCTVAQEVGMQAITYTDFKDLKTRLEPLLES